MLYDVLLPKLKDAKIFSKLDVKEAYWHVRLDEAFSKPTTMITPFGRYMWKLIVLYDVLPKLKDAKIFSKLTTVITPFGRYMWKRLPFGLKVSSKIFQRKIDEALGDLDVVFNIVVDVVIVGCGNSDAKAQSDNQQKLAVTLKSSDID